MKKLLLLGWVLVLCSFVGNEGYEYIDIISLKRKPIVAATLNGQKAYFLVDTGSDASILHLPFAEKYRFVKSRGGDYKVTGVTNSSFEMTDVANVHLQLGSQRIHTHFLGMDLKPIMKPIRHKSGLTIAGIIGSDVMKKYHFQIDFANKKIGILIKNKKRFAKRQHDRLADND